MGEIVNLRRARKARIRADKDAGAAANRAAFGRTRAEKDGQDAVRTLETRKLDGHRRDARPDDE